MYLGLVYLGGRERAVTVCRFIDIWNPTEHTVYSSSTHIRHIDHTGNFPSLNAVNNSNDIHIVRSSWT